MKTKREKEAELLKQLLLHPAAYHAGLFGMLFIRSVEDGRFAVYSDDKHIIEEEELFENVNDAIRRFLDLREEHHLGLDYETVNKTEDTIDYYAFNAEVIDFDKLTSMARAQAEDSKARYNFSSLCFHSGRISRFPKPGDKVEIFIGRNHGIIVSVKLRS